MRWNSLLLLFFLSSVFSFPHVIHKRERKNAIIPYEEYFEIEKKEEERNEKRVQYVKEKGIGMLVGGLQTADYFISVKMGQPQQSFSFEVDTGSTFSILVGKSCKSSDNEPCPHTVNNGGYDQGPSSKNLTFDKSWCEKCGKEGMENQCCFTTKYYDGTEGWGWLVNDLSNTFGVLGSINFINVQSQTPFGENTLFSTRMDGILGLADGGPTNAIEELEEENEWIDGVFCMCFGMSDGLFIAGSSNCTSGNYNSSPIHYTPYLSRDPNLNSTLKQIDNTYSVQLLSIAFGKDAFASGSEIVATVDSGIHGILFPSDFYHQFVASVEDYCKKTKNPSQLFCSSETNNILDIPDSSCVYTTRAELRKLPPLVFTFPEMGTGKSFELALNGTIYVQWFPITSWKYEYCAALSIKPYNHSYVTLGDKFMHGTHTIFDRKKIRIGFALPDKIACGNAVSRNLGVQLFIGFIGLLVILVILFVIFKQYQKRHKYRVIKSSMHKSSIDFNSTDDLIGYERRSAIY